MTLKLLALGSDRMACVPHFLQADEFFFSKAAAGAGLVLLLLLIRWARPRQRVIHNF
jgi:hypothetical protein